MKYESRGYWQLVLSHRFGIWQAPRQHCCWGACQIFERSNNCKNKSRGLEPSWDLTIRRLIGYWNGALVSSTNEHGLGDHRGSQYHMVIYVCSCACAHESVKACSWLSMLECFILILCICVPLYIIVIFDKETFRVGIYVVRKFIEFQMWSSFFASVTVYHTKLFIEKSVVFWHIFFICLVIWPVTFGA